MPESQAPAAGWGGGGMPESPAGGSHLWVRLVSGEVLLVRVSRSEGFVVHLLIFTASSADRLRSMVSR